MTGLLGWNPQWQPDQRFGPYAKDMDQAMMNFAYPVAHPIDMLSGIGGLISGAASKVGVGNDPEAEQMVSGAGDYLSRYSPSNIGQTLTQHPFTSAVDLMPAAGGAYNLSRLGRRAALGAAESAPFAPLPARSPNQPLIAYHGSPYDINKFELGRVKSGSGFEEQGRGVYLTSNDARAKGWGDFAIRNQNLPMNTKTKTYEVKVNTPADKILDYDKPISEQPADIQALAKKYNVSKSAKEGKVDNPNIHHLLTAIRKKGWANPDLNLDAPGVFSDELKGLGYRGVQFEHGGIANWNIFDPEDLEILRKYGLIGAIGAGAYAEGKR